MYKYWLQISQERKWDTQIPVNKVVFKVIVYKVRGSIPSYTPYQWIAKEQSLFLYGRNVAVGLVSFLTMNSQITAVKDLHKKTFF